MKTILAMVCLVASTAAANAQYGVSNTRDANGNLIRSTGMNPSRNYDQQPVNNLQNGANRAPATSSSGMVPSSASGIRR